MPAHFFEERQFLIDTTKHGGNMIILGIDSSEPDKNIGRIGDRGIEAIAELQSYPDDIIKILCFHHHLLPCQQSNLVHYLYPYPID